MRRPRVSIAGLMGAVAAAAVGLAALRFSTPGWSGSIYLLTRAILGLAILLALHRSGPSRAWWLGFALFGWGYEWLITPMSRYSPPFLPTVRLLLAAKPLLFHPLDVNRGGSSGLLPSPFGELYDYQYLRIGDDLWALAAALLGAAVARIAWRPTDRVEPAPVLSAPAGGVGRMRRRWILIPAAGWAVLVVGTSVVALRSSGQSGFWAGATFLLVLAGLGLAGVGAFAARGRVRRSCTGAALLGGGYLVLVFSHSPYLPLPTSQLLHGLRLGFPWLASPNAVASARILDELERPIALEFPEPTPLKDVLESLRRATARSGRPGLPIYLDPIGLQEVEKSPDTTVTIDVRDVPLKTALRAVLRPVGMDFVVQDGLLFVTSQDSADFGDNPFAEAFSQQYVRTYPYEDGRIAPSPELEDPYLIVGHCLLAMVAAGLGALAAPILAGGADAMRNVG